LIYALNFKRYKSLKMELLMEVLDNN